jgi:D-3-phosphoglycerate dehydrogenase
MTQQVVAVLDVYAPAVREAIARVAPPGFVLHFADSYDETEQNRLAAGADFLLPGWARVSAEMLAGAPRLRMVQKWGIGVDRIDVDALRARGIPLSITAGANASPVAEHAIMLMLAVFRRVSQVDRALREGRWMKAEMRSLGLQLTGKTVGLVGFGAIGRHVALKLRGFETRTLYYDLNRLDPVSERAFAAEFRPLDALLAESDVVSLHAPYTPRTRNLIDARALGLMKASAILVNTARGELVDEAALHEALVSGRLHGAGLDAFAEEPPPKTNPLLSLDQVVVTPHTGGAAYDNVERTAQHAFGNMQRFLAGEEIAAADVIVPVGRALSEHAA